MHMQFAVLYLLTITVVLTARNVVIGSYVSCRQNIGVYRITLKTAQLNVTIYEIITFHPDGTANGISSLEGGDLTHNPPLPPFSSYDGGWKCDGANGIVANVDFFLYRTPVTPALFRNGIAKLRFSKNGRINGTLVATNYDLVSTSNPNQSKWKKISGDTSTVEGYKLFNLSSPYIF